MELITPHVRKRPFGDKRRSTRQALVVPARLSWKDQRGTTRFANVVTRDISDEAIYVDWQGPSAIPLYRLVQFQVVSEARRAENLPASLRTGKVLSAVFRIGQRRRATGAPEGYALRMLVAPSASASESAGAAEDLVSATA